jgi:hypothetical protein
MVELGLRTGRQRRGQRGEESEQQYVDQPASPGVDAPQPVPPAHG